MKSPKILNIKQRSKKVQDLLISEKWIKNINIYTLWKKEFLPGV